MANTKYWITSKFVQRAMLEHIGYKHGGKDIVRSQFWYSIVVRSHLTATCDTSASVISGDLVGVSGWVRLWLWHSTDGCWGRTGVIWRVHRRGSRYRSGCIRARWYRTGCIRARWRWIGWIRRSNKARRILRGHHRVVSRGRRRGIFASAEEEE